MEIVCVGIKRGGADAEALIFFLNPTSSIYCAEMANVNSPILK